MSTDRTSVEHALVEVAQSFGSPAKETILYENFGKHIYEVMLLLKLSSPQCKILDVGGGLGVNLMCLRVLLGDSLSLHLIDRFEEYDEENRMGPRANAFTLLAERNIQVFNRDFLAHPALPYANGAFDIVTCFDVIEHLPHHPLGLFSEIRRVLKPGGSFLLSGPNAVALSKRVLLMLGRHPYIPFDLWCREKYFSHYREYTAREMEKLVALSGFEVTETELIPEPYRTRVKHRKPAEGGERTSAKQIVISALYLVEMVLPAVRETVYCTAVKAEETADRRTPARC